MGFLENAILVLAGINLLVPITLAFLPLQPDQADTLTGALTCNKANGGRDRRA